MLYSHILVSNNVKKISFTSIDKLTCDKQNKWFNVFMNNFINNKKPHYIDNYTNTIYM